MDRKHESSDVVEDIEPISMMVTDDSDGNTNKRDLDTNGTVHERPIKKPKFELRLPEGFLDPIICDRQQQPMVVVSPVSSTVGENGVRVNEKEKDIVSSSLIKIRLLIEAAGTKCCCCFGVDAAKDFKENMLMD
uniref:Histidine kinase-like ATPase, C-terminal domain-containing protein n=1 Tax=Tanacetum cinerariifolium TaxID=118510 RepID=A0A6L2MA77_TANCI|nr:histidine kinase-like ATPase, C-terminal domain-containing protein [Tanacetum cinerariifolium]